MPHAEQSRLEIQKKLTRARKRFDRRGGRAQAITTAGERKKQREDIAFLEKQLKDRLKEDRKNARKKFPKSSPVVRALTGAAKGIKAVLKSKSSSLDVSPLDDKPRAPKGNLSIEAAKRLSPEFKKQEEAFEKEKKRRVHAEEELDILQKESREIVAAVVEAKSPTPNPQSDPIKVHPSALTPAPATATAAATKPDGTSGPAFDPSGDEVKPPPNGPNKAVAEQRAAASKASGGGKFESGDLIKELKEIRDNPNIPRSDRMAAHRRINDLLGLVTGGTGTNASAGRASRAKSLMHNVERLMRQKGMTKEEAIEHIRFTSGSPMNDALLDNLAGMSTGAIQRGNLRLGRFKRSGKETAGAQAALAQLAASGSSGTITAPVPQLLIPQNPQDVQGQPGITADGFRQGTRQENDPNFAKGGAFNQRTGQFNKGFKFKR